jgi:hypothetical protein
VFVQEVAAAGSGDAKADHVVNTRDQVRRILDQISDQTPEESPEVRS